MKPRDKRVYVKYALMTLFSISTATGTAVLAFQKSLTESFVVLLSSAVLLVSSALLGVSITGSTDNTKRTALLVFSIGVLVLFVGSAAWILFSQNDEEAADGQYAEIITPTKPISSNVTDTENIEEPVSSLNEAVNIEREGDESAVTASVPTLSAVTSVIITPEIVNVEPRRPEASAVTASSEIIPDSEIVNITPRVPDSPSLSVVSFALPEENIIDVEARMPEPCTVEAESLLIPETIDISPRLPSPAVISSETSVRADAEEVLVTPKPPQIAEPEAVTGLNNHPVIVKLPEMPKLEVETEISNIPEVISIKVCIPDIPSIKAETYSVIDIVPREIPAEAAMISETEMKSQPEIISIEPRVPETASIEAETAVEEIPAIIDIEPRLPEITKLSASSTIITDPAIITISPRVPSAPLASAETAISEIPVVVNIPAPEPEVEIIEEEVLPEPEPIETVEETADDFFFGLSPEEADFWASFYIEGEDELSLLDGIYYMDLIINGSYVGPIEVEAATQEISLRSSEFESYISDSVIDELKDSIFSDGDKYISLENLRSLGISASYDVNTYEVFVDFAPTDMPVQVLSIRGNSRRSVFRPITGGMMLDPAVFVLRTNWELSGYTNSFRYFNWKNSLRFSFTSNNTGRLFDVNFNFSYYLNFSLSSINFRMGSYRFYTDFQDAMIRLSWGNISSDVLSSRGRAFGVRFDRSYVYGDSNASRKSYLEKMLIIDKESEVIIYNEGKEIFRRTLDPGSYKLEDFILYTGANTILIRVEPLDGSAPSEQTIEIMYSGSLLPPGEIQYGAALLTGRETSSRKDESADVLSIKLGNQYLKYDWKNVVLSGYIKAGLTDTLTLNATLGLQNYPEENRGWNPRIRLNTELTHANILGTTRYNLNLGEYMNDQGTFGIPRIYARISHQVSTGWTPISSLNFSFTYSNPEETGVADRHRFSLSTSLSGRVGIFSWSTGLSGTLYSDVLNRFSWSWSNTLSFSFSRNFWITGSMFLSGSGVENVPAVSGRVYATVRFGGGSVSASSGFKDLSVSANYSNGPHSVSGSIGTSNFTNPAAYNIDADYSFNGKWVDVSVGAGTSLAFNDGNASFSLSTTTVFADGMFAIGSYIPTNFLLIRQYDALKGNKLSVGSAGSSRTDELDSSFGTSVYTGLSATRGTAFSLYSSNDSSFSGTQIFDINVPPSDLYGYVLRLRADAKYAVTGTVTLPDGTLLYNGSSPLYEYSIGENGEVVLTATDDYVFTDADGRFTVSDLAPGSYAFDIMYGSEWILAVFTVENLESSASDIQVLQQLEMVGNDEVVLPSVYSGVTYYDFSKVITNEEFWQMLYPEFGEVAV